MESSPPVPLANGEPMYGGYSRFEIELEVSNYEPISSRTSF